MIAFTQTAECAFRQWQNFGEHQGQNFVGILGIGFIMGIIELSLLIADPLVGRRIGTIQLELGVTGYTVWERDVATGRPNTGHTCA